MVDGGLLQETVTKEIIGAAFEVHRVLGYGFLEKVYQRSMQVELQRRGLTAEIESEIRVLYKNVEVGFYKSDLFVNRAVIVELKAAKDYNSEDEAQLLNELKATGIRVGLLINFGRTKVEFKRFAY
ncbi:MAG: GxxExxY protein [Planctomycetes bacterium]|nr:GxxExxY protein [Planctomycetota bacterium]